MPFTIHRGTNISHWLSQSNARGEERCRRFTRDNVRRLADLGLDHLRLPVDEEQLFDADDRREPERAGADVDVGRQRRPDRLLESRPSRRRTRDREENRAT